jgi:hypothetical protein
MGEQKFPAAGIDHQKISMGTCCDVATHENIQDGESILFLLEQGETGNSVVVLSQLRLIGSKRLIRKTQTLEEWQSKNIVRAIKALLPDSATTALELAQIAEMCWS